MPKRSRPIDDYVAEVETRYGGFKSNRTLVAELANKEKAMAKHRKEAKIYFAVDGEKGYYIGSTEWPDERQREHERFGKRIIEEFPTTHQARYNDEYELIEFAEGMGIPLTNEYRKRHSNWKENRHKSDR